MSREEELLVEVIRLVRKYEVDTFQQLFAILSDPDALANMLKVLELAPTITDASEGSHIGEARSKPGTRFLDTLARDDPEKAAFLFEVRDKIMEGETFRDLYEVRRFAEENSISLGSAKSRLAMVVPLVRFLATCSIEAANSLLVPYGRSDRTLQRWSEVIMRDRNQRERSPLSDTRSPAS